MAKRRLLWKLFLSYLAVILFCAVAVSGNAVEWISPFYRSDRLRELEEKCRLIEPEILAELDRPGGDVDALCKLLGLAASTRITVVRPDGTVLGDTEESPGEMVNHADRPEIREALEGTVGKSSRWSDTRRLDMVYVAVPLKSGDRIRGVLRTSISMGRLDEAVDYVNKRIALGMLVVAGASCGVALLLSWRISRPLAQMRKQVEGFARGDFGHKLPAGGDDEIAGLADALNAMAEELGQRIETITRLQHEMSAILSSMTEGVLAVDDEGRVISANDVAARLFGFDQPAVRGRSLLEVVRNPDLQNFVAGVRPTGGVSEGEISLGSGKDERRLELHGGILRDARERDIGVLVVIKDVTRLRHLERVRRDFVANVSHELKTPITSIQGAVETLREGAMHDAQAADRFLDILARQAERMNAIVDDLLTLSRVERDAEDLRVETASARVADVVQAALADCRQKAEERGITIALLCPEDLRARLNAQFIEQALANLLDNSIKFSKPGSEVKVEVERRGSGLVLRVSDRGCGIAPAHLPRIFERFYCADWARSRELGGTGLGLAIVKHIAQAHGGSVAVESTVGLGSTFTITLPAACPCQ